MERKMKTHEKEKFQAQLDLFMAGNPKAMCEPAATNLPKALGVSRRFRIGSGPSREQRYQAGRRCPSATSISLPGHSPDGPGYL